MIDPLGTADQAIPCQCNVSFSPNWKASKMRSKRSLRQTYPASFRRNSWLAVAASLTLSEVSPLDTLSLPSSHLSYISYSSCPWHDTTLHLVWEMKGITLYFSFTDSFIPSFTFLLLSSPKPSIISVLWVCVIIFCENIRRNIWWDEITYCIVTYPVQLCQSIRIKISFVAKLTTGCFKCFPKISNTTTLFLRKSEIHWNYLELTFDQLSFSIFSSLWQ